jgi:methionyl-tRNA formyltransferase
MSALQLFIRRASNSTADDGAELSDEAALRELADSHGFPLHVTSDLHDQQSLELVRSVSPDLGVVIGTTILKPSLFELPRLGSVNLHQARVPEYQGSRALFWALYNDEPEMGITIHRVASKVDAGDVILETSVPLEYDFQRFRGEYDAFAQEFSEAIRKPSVELMLEAVRQLARGEAKSRAQDAGRAVRRRIPTYSQTRQLKRILEARYRQRRNGAPAGRPSAEPAP